MNLIFLRHGQSIWNLENRFTGWVDVGLSDGGVDEALKAGNLQKITLPSLQTTIDDNLGIYLNRTYRIFDDPSYAKNIPEKAR